jgi:hypothetical protein
MIAVIEIMLTMAAWKRGWKGWALLPLGIGFIMAFWAGSMLGAAGFSEDETYGICLVLDGVAILVLIVMAAVGRRIQPKIYTPVQNSLTEKPAGQPLTHGYSQTSNLSQHSHQIRS